MDAEIQFFMTEKDTNDFFSFSEKHIDKIESFSLKNKIEKLSRCLIVGDCELIFTPSLMEGKNLYLGRLEIRLGKVNVKYQDIEKAKSAFRKLRNWIKKSYFSRLAYRDQNNKLIPSRAHWLGVDAKKWKQADAENHVLKLSKTSSTTFDIGF